jgi:hypothetical protein
LHWLTFCSPEDLEDKEVKIAREEQKVKTEIERILNAYQQEPSERPSS